jgi:hypothetical protein
MHENILRDEVRPVRHGQIVDLMFADRFDGNDLIPVNIWRRDTAQVIIVSTSAKRARRSRGTACFDAKK